MTIEGNLPPSGSGDSSSGEIVVDTRCALALAEELLEGASADHPLMQGQSADTQRIVHILCGTCAETIEREREGMNTKLGHGSTLL